MAHCNLFAGAAHLNSSINVTRLWKWCGGICNDPKMKRQIWREKSFVEQLTHGGCRSAYYLFMRYHELCHELLILRQEMRNTLQIPAIFTFMLPIPTHPVKNCWVYLVFGICRLCWFVAWVLVVRSSKHYQLWLWISLENKSHSSEDEAMLTLALLTLTV